MSGKQEVKAAIASDTAKLDAFPFRVSVDLIDQDDLIFPFRTEGEADDFIGAVFARGYVVRDRSADASRVYSVIYPASQIRSITIYEAVD